LPFNVVLPGCVRLVVLDRRRVVSYLEWLRTDPSHVGLWRRLPSGVERLVGVEPLPLKVKRSGQ
jgi:hypothetical protein